MGDAHRLRLRCAQSRQQALRHLTAQRLPCATAPMVGKLKLMAVHPRFIAAGKSTSIMSLQLSALQLK